MRKVQVYKYEKPVSPSSVWTKVEDGKGMFHQFGVNCEELNEGTGTFTSAIVEMPDGIVKNVPVENIKFLDSPEDKSSNK
ncbi:MAG: hypothetical protein KAV87_17945 [Desulfobacteraceae bacterium]|nr:hypothetical protein [Desulfobacteraceae bacterium]